MKNSFELRRVLRFWDVIGLAAGAAIGAGIFRISHSISAILPYPGLILICWVVGGVIALSGALVYGDLARRYPEVGGDYTYLKKGLGGTVAFLFAWTKVFIVQPASIAAISFIFAAYFQTFFPIEGFQVQTIAILGILFLSILNILGIQKGVFFQNLTTLLKVASIAFIAVSAFCVPAKGIINFQPLFPTALELPLVQAVGLSLMFILWTFGGWNEGVFLAGEMKRPREELPKGLFLGALLIILTYLLINTAYHYHLPVNEIAKNETPATLLVSALFGPQASRWLALLIALSTFGALNGLILTGGRVGYAFAQDHRWFSWIARISPRFQTPANGIFLIVLISILMVFSATFEKLVIFESIIVWFFFLLVVVVLIKVFLAEKREGVTVRLFKWLPLAIWGGAGSCLVLNAAISRPIEALIGIGITMIGLPIYFFEKRGQGAENSKS